MIRSTATEEELESPFYLKHRQIALDYEQLAKEAQGQIEGTYNAFFVDLKADLPFKNGSLSLYLFEQLNFVTLDDANRHKMYTTRSNFDLQLSNRPKLSLAVPMILALDR